MGSYRVLQLVARGPASELYAARDEAADRAVALKLLAPVAGDGVDSDSGGADRLRRFVDEAHMLASLRHPDIVETYGAGEHLGRAWIAMEWVTGHDLDRYTVAARLLPEPLVLKIVERLARALGHAHRNGVVHRDVKPHNVRVDLPADKVKLADFGVARAHDSTRTRTGVILGTPVYMAPEQLAGAAADARGDLYSLGVVLFELLTARRPHESASMGDLLRQIASTPAPDLRTFRPDLPAPLAAELARVLSKRASERHPDADYFADALARARLHTVPAAGRR